VELLGGNIVQCFYVPSQWLPGPVEHGYLAEGSG